MNVRKRIRFTPGISDNPTTDSDDLAHELPNDLFCKIFSMSQSQLMPPGWNKIVPINQPNHIIFCQVLSIKSKDDNLLTPAFGKMVTLTNQALVELSYLGRPLNIDSFEQNKLLTSQIQLINIIEMFDKKSMCRGVNINKNVHKTSTIFEDISGNWRHIRCKMFVDGGNLLNYFKIILFPSSFSISSYPFWMLDIKE